MTRCPMYISSLVAALVTLALVPYVRAKDADDLESVKAGRTSLSRTSYPWYDRQSDGVRRVDAVKKRSGGSDHRDSSWETQPGNSSFNPPLLGFSSLFSLLIHVVFWLLNAAVLGLLVWLVVRVFLKMETIQAGQARSTELAQSSSDLDRVENLPFKVKRPHVDLLAEAQRYYEEGRFREAIIYLFSYMLVQLDKHQLIRLAKGKTNRQYLWEVRPKQRLFQLLENTMVSFEDVFFGDHDLMRREFESSWHALDEFHEQVNQGVAS